MQGWIENDADGRSFLVRAGTGRVSAIVPVGSPNEDGAMPFHAVVIEIDAQPERPRSVRLSTRGQVSDGDPLHDEARAGLADQRIRSWSIAWHRHSWVPNELAITSLDLQSDTQAWLLSLERISASAGDPAELRAAEEVEHD